MNAKHTPDKIKCSSCGISIPDVPEDATGDELLCNACYEASEASTMSAKHTPGEWVAQDLYNGTIPIDAPPSSTGFDESYEICRVSNQDDDHETQQANARLIAQCPKMYDYISQRADNGDTEAQKIISQINA